MVVFFVYNFITVVIFLFRAQLFVQLLYPDLFGAGVSQIKYPHQMVVLQSRYIC